MKLKYCRHICITFFITLFTSTAHAAWYQVEVIVFDQLSPDFDGELWYENPGLPDRSNSIELIEELADVDEQDSAMEAQEVLQNKAELIPYLQLSSEDLKLQGVERVLKLSREYRPIMHVAWQQPGLASNNARAVHIQKFEEIEELPAGEILGQASADQGISDNTPALQNDVYQVLDLIFDGTIRVRSSKFLHVDVDIAYFPKFMANEYREQGENDSLFVQQRADYVRLQESRKIRLNEIHYFDHPIFGVIIRVSRLSSR